MRLSSFALAACLAAAASEAAAAPVTYSGSGTLSQAAGKLPLTGMVPVGSPFSFSFTFDPTKAVLFEASQGYAIYDLALTNVAVTMSGYSYALSAEPEYVPFIELYRAFSFFPGSSTSEESVAFTFFLTGKPSAGNASEPFGGASGKSQLVSIGGVLRQADDGTPLTLDSIIGQGPTYYSSFEYGTRDALTKQSGFLRGSYVGAFSSGVPELQNWAMMIAGVAICGFSLRRRRSSQAAPNRLVVC
ncbi:hypothetical protein [Sphingomonas sp. R1]|uniref:hypothetical protein n=1 Tax=Sphingomonas sp. R1 TaxID=399176 RepID=UPI0022245040|nr:hypothetical protein [Sphingomonas sp. R1]UYY76823.1 hypothetical protein OIM94_15130 [Sphingomonas sp. R1]